MRLKRILIIHTSMVGLIMALSISLDIHGQTNEEQIIKLGLTETYVVDVTFESILFDTKFKCRFNQALDNKYIMYKIKIHNIRYIADSSIYKNFDIRDVTYALVHRSAFINLNKRVTATFFNSHSKKYLLFNRTLCMKDNIDYSYWQHAVLNELSKCRNAKKQENILRNLSKTDQD